MIYDIVTFSQTMTGMQLLPAGHLGIYYITILPGQSLILTAMQVAQTEDFSIRCWFSDSNSPGGISLVSGTQQVFPLDRMPINYILYDIALEDTIVLPESVFSLALQPGTYILNFLNLINVENILSFNIKPLQGN